MNNPLPFPDAAIAADARALRGRRVGIVGGGQLGSMLCQAARKLDVHTTLLAPDPGCPAARHADELVVGDYGDVSAAEALAARTDCITFEIETVSPEVLRRLADLTRLQRVRVAPDPSVMLRLQNKLTQKQWLRRNGLPINRFLAWNGHDPDPGQLGRHFGLPLVQKALTGGYDGRGGQILKNRAALADLWLQPSLIEACLTGIRELSVLVADNGNGEVSVYDPVELEFLDAANILDRVIAPARISRALKRRAIGIARAVVSRLNTPGLFAIELFALPDDSLLINEISPRVHNSGHHTIEACRTSQFEQQLRAVLGAPLGPAGLLTPAITQNILNDPKLPVGAPARVRGAAADTIVHWYGKAPDRPWRKLGHVTCLTDDPVLARQRTLTVLSAAADPATRTGS
ncbi:MAG: 5-(carboxyamino)imidazole ribonucleotide synthase [Pseudomonadales bacterium]